MQKYPTKKRNFIERALNGLEGKTHALTVCQSGHENRGFEEPLRYFSFFRKGF